MPEIKNILGIIATFCLVSRKQLIRSDAQYQAETNAGEIALAGNTVL